MRDSRTNGATAAEFSLRALAIEALAVCRDADIRSASIAVDCANRCGCDQWNVTFEMEDGKSVQVSTEYGDADA